MRKCHCGSTGFDKGRALDGRRAYRCQGCGDIHTSGLQGRKPRYSKQREGFQFASSRAKEDSK